MSEMFSLRNAANKKPFLRYFSRVYEPRFVSSATVLLYITGRMVRFMFLKMFKFHHEISK